jgi:hypothetical protein
LVKRYLLVGLLAVVLASTLALAQGVQVKMFTVGNRAIGFFTNLTGAAVTGFHIEFDQPVTLLYKVEAGGFVQNVTGETEGIAFDFAGQLVSYATVELDWQPASAKVALFQWVADGQPAGAPYYTTLSAFLKVLVGGLVALREQAPEQFGSLLESFFAANPDLGAALAEAGIPAEMLIASLMTAPPEGIMNLLLTLVEGFGIQTLEDFLAVIDLSLLLEALGL